MVFYSLLIACLGFPFAVFKYGRSDEPPYERTAETAERDSEGGIPDGCAKGNSKDYSDDRSQNNVETKLFIHAASPQ
jgi:hypothetical protein